ncbi:MAG: hypothetical protein ACPL4E_06850 [Thermoproteota archaeon]
MPTGLRGELAGKTIKKLEFCGYVSELHFPKHFTLKSLEGDVFLDFVEDGLKIGGFKVEGFELEGMLRDPSYGPGLTVKTSVKSVERGSELVLRFYDNGEVRIVSGGNALSIKEISLETRRIEGEEIASLTITRESVGEDTKSIYPIKTLKLEIGKKYPMDFSVKDDRTTSLLSEVRKIFGYDAFNEVQKEMETGKVRVRIAFDDGTTASISGKELVVIFTIMFANL